MVTKKRLLARSLTVAALGFLLLFSLAACGNSKAQASSKSQASASPSAEEENGTAMSREFQKGGIWFLSSTPSMTESKLSTRLQDIC